MFPFRKGYGDPGQAVLQSLRSIVAGYVRVCVCVSVSVLIKFIPACIAGPGANELNCER
jgi:hypothetical protein